MVAGLQVSDAVVRFKDITAVDHVSLHVENGHVLAILGPSGSGKSTLLRAIAGLTPLDSGQVIWNGQDLSRVKVHKRGIGVVFQAGHLFPGMDVGSNVAYGLSKLGRRERAARVAEMLELVGLAGYEHRRVTELSGGQAQRVALARSLAPSPRALMLDEPLSALDRGMREDLAGEMARILREASTTAVYVTHDQEEASTIADTVAVLTNGRLVQRADPAELWQRPASQQVARFLGYRAFIPADEARYLGWKGTLEPGHLLGIGPRSLEFDPDGEELLVLNQGFSLGHVEITVALPDGQEAVVLAPEKVPSSTVRLTLVSGAQVPA